MTTIDLAEIAKLQGVPRVRHGGHQACALCGGFVTKPKGPSMLCVGDEAAPVDDESRHLEMRPLHDECTERVRLQLGERFALFVLHVGKRGKRWRRGKPIAPPRPVYPPSILDTLADEAKADKEAKRARLAGAIVEGSVKMFDRALTDEEVAEEFRRGAGSHPYEPVEVTKARVDAAVPEVGEARAKGMNVGQHRIAKWRERNAGEPTEVLLADYAADPSDEDLVTILDRLIVGQTKTLAAETEQAFANKIDGLLVAALMHARASGSAGGFEGMKPSVQELDDGDDDLIAAFGAENRIAEIRRQIRELLRGRR